MLEKLKSLFGRSKTAAVDSAPTPAIEEAWKARRWEAAETNRLNRAHWKKAIEQPINADLYADLGILRTRTTWELARNPLLEGVVSTYSSDVAGEDGPMLRCSSKSPAYNRALQAVWWDWFNKPEITGKLSGADMIALWVRRLMDSGEFLAQRVSKREEAGPVSFRLKLIHPRRLATPSERSGDYDIALGVKRTEHGEPTHYYILDPEKFGAFELDLSKYKTLAASELIHEFITVEEDQVRGFPWLATPLQATADLRDFDSQVLDAARAAADQALIWFTDHKDAPFLNVNESVEVERRMQQTGPPGWKPMQMKPEQPTINYVEYRSDRMREIGRPFGMPLMMIRLGSEQHNFSSARFDNEIYKRGVRRIRRWLERRALNSFVYEIKREAELFAAANDKWIYAAALRNPPTDFDFSFVWQPLTAVDAEKDATDEETRMRNGTLPFDEACARSGSEAESNIKKIAQMVKDFRAEGLPMPAWMKDWVDPAVKAQTELANAQNPKQPPTQTGRMKVRRGRK